jgi:CheY-like chemotaxis protein
MLGTAPSQTCHAAGLTSRHCVRVSTGAARQGGAGRSGAVMQVCRIRIVEDEPMVALALEEIVLGLAEGRARVALTASVHEARRALADPVFDAALLDIDVLDGKTYDLATALGESGLPFAFISGSWPDELPPGLRMVPVVPKPYDPAEIEPTLRAKLSPPT